jgi:glyoxylase-like metal-dependent hydrolase (beta-lactamase superfamily II)
VITVIPDFGLGPVPEPGRVDEVAPGVQRLTAPNPGLMTGPGTNTYLVGHDDPVVIDPGPSGLPAHSDAIVAAASALGSVRAIVVTHTHVDHAPGAAALAAVTGAPVIGFGPREGFEPDHCVGEGFQLDVGGLTLRAVHTPGHASDHLCWSVEEHAMLLTGDHVMHGSTVVIRPPDGDLHQYRSSLLRVRDGGPPWRMLAPGHGRVMDHVDDVVDALVAHRDDRHEKVAAALVTRRDVTVDDLLAMAYGDVSDRQLPVARFSLWAHLRALVQEGRALVDAPAGSDTIESHWSPT